jgi:heparan-sulfate lyase
MPEETNADKGPVGTGEVMSWTSRDKDGEIELHSLPAEEILEKLDLSNPGLEAAEEAAGRGDREAALGELLAYYRRKYTLPEPAEEEKGDFSQADKIVEHIFQFGPYEAAAYGEEVDWEWDPRGDIEWVASVYRFYWARPLEAAFRATGDEKYAGAFVELTRDWIGKHRLEDHRKTHSVYTHWKGFAWLDIQTGIRATNLCAVVRTFIHANCFTPEFLGLFLASMYDHQIKTELIPMGQVHNKAIFEQRGFINVSHTFPEFKDNQRWLEMAFGRARESLLEQTTTDGVQREWSFGYHSGVLSDAVEIMGRMEATGFAVPEDFRERVRRMYDYVFAIATPDLGAPMFGDGSRPLWTTDERSDWPLYSVLKGATSLLDDPKFAARADLDRERLPAQTSCAFPEAGLYVLRDDWGPEGIYLGLHCSQPAISSHDQPDNGTFELCAYGRWLMPDTGFFTYGHDPKGRAWHRQTRVHQTLTLDGGDSADAGCQLLWQTSDDLDALVVENGSYEELIHRRSVWFVEKRFFVLLDEAIGDASGLLELHFQFAPGEVEFAFAEGRASTAFDDANVLVAAAAGSRVEGVEEEGWFAWSYGKREPRKAFCFRHGETAPAAFVTLVVPYRGTEKPEVEAVYPEGLEVGAEGVELEVCVDGRRWKIGRDLARGTAWKEELE